MSRTYTISCDGPGCDWWIDGDDRADAEVEAQREGWRIRPYQDDLCPHCRKAVS